MLRTFAVAAMFTLAASQAHAGMRVFQFEGHKVTDQQLLDFPCAPNCAPNPDLSLLMTVDLAFRWATWDGQGDSRDGYLVPWSGTRLDVNFGERSWSLDDFGGMNLNEFAHGLLSYVVGEGPLDTWFRVYARIPGVYARIPGAHSTYPEIALDGDGAVVVDQYGWHFFSSANRFNLKYDKLTAVPEPASWALMIAGLGVAGAMLRRSVFPSRRSGSATASLCEGAPR
jgi:hypothetical protein